MQCARMQPMNQSYPSKTPSTAPSLLSVPGYQPCDEHTQQRGGGGGAGYHGLVRGAGVGPGAL